MAYNFVSCIHSVFVEIQKIFQTPHSRFVTVCDSPLLFSNWLTDIYNAAYLYSGEIDEETAEETAEEMPTATSTLETLANTNPMSYP